jgi:hypothetical protein
MADEVYGFDEQGMRRAVGAIRAVEASQPRPSRANARSNWQHVRITGPAVDVTESDSDDSDADSYAYANDLVFYPAIVVAWDSSAEADAEYGPVWVLDRNQVGFEDGEVLTCRQSGDVTLNAEQRPLFVATQGAGVGGEFEEITFVADICPIEVDSSDSDSIPPS